MKNNHIKKQVKKLAKQKMYEDIYVIYGRKWFLKYVPKKYQKADRKKLWKEGKFLDIYNKYGSIDYEEIQEKEIENETGKEPTIGQIIKIWCKRALRIILLSGLMTDTALGIARGVGTDNIIEENGQKYAKEIENYQKEIQEYAKTINQKKYTDLEIFMKLMKDMYETTRGYGQPEIDAQGYYGMDMQEGGIGVCRNIADNIADKLNAINPDYNARSITCISNYSNIEYNNMENKIVMDDNTTLILQGNETRWYDDKGQLIKIKTKEDDREVEQEYENGNIVRTKITYQDGNAEIIETYEDDRLKYKNILTDKEYISEGYDEAGNASWKQVADKTKEITTYYNDGEKYQQIIQEKNRQTTITYENEEIVSKEEEELEEYDNIYLKLKQSKKLRESTTTITNHAVVIADVEKDNATIILDPTNGTIGTYKDGNIVIFNETEEKDPIKRSFLGDLLYSGTENFIEFPKEWLQSFLNPSISVEELEKKYGVEAQNKALTKIEKEEKQKSFMEEIKYEGKIGESQAKENEDVYNITTGKARIFGEEYDITK